MQPIFFLILFATVVNGVALFHVNHNILDNSTSWIKKRPEAPRLFFDILHKHKIRYPQLDKIPTPQPIVNANCICVPYYLCNINNTIIVDGSGIIDVRLLTPPFIYRRCTGDLEVCCRLPPAPIVTPTTTTMRPTTTTPKPTTTTPKPTTTTPKPTPTTPKPTPTTTTTTTPKPTTTTTTTTTPRPTTTTPKPTTTTQKAPSTICFCVPINLCDVAGYIVVGGEGVINPRQTLSPCPNAGYICCQLRSPVIVPPIINPRPPTCGCTQIYRCDGYGNIIYSGGGIIDPRYPTFRQGQVVSSCISPVQQICCIYDRQDTSIGFPIQAQYPSNPVVLNIIRNPGTSQACTCCQSWQCTQGNAIYLDGAGIIDPRFNACPSNDQICCRPQGIIQGNSVTSPIFNYGRSGGGGGGNLIGNSNSICGVQSTNCLATQSCSTKAGETSFAEFPWMVALLIRQADVTSADSMQFQCGASIINTRSILTAAHCIIDRPSGVLVARVGEWNTANTDEPAPFQESVVQAVVTHPLYYKGGLYNDVAVLILTTPISYAINVMPICLPQQGMTFAPGTSCWATGWGRSAFQGQYQTIMRKVDLPIVERNDCQTQLRATKLGQYFQLHESFICAGGETSKDTCKGDGGGPLVCPTASGQYVQAGIVSWGIGCGESKTPAVYASVSQFRQWIDEQLANYGVL